MRNPPDAPGSANKGAANDGNRCWDGKNLDSANHIDHVAYPTQGPSNFLSTGDCPASHPVKIPQLMLEVRPPFNPLTCSSPPDFQLG